MNEKPILFSGEMVRAILAGRKTQTRRVVKLDKLLRHLGVDEDHTIGFVPHGDEFLLTTVYGPEDEVITWGNVQTRFRCPYGVPGDRLWVRETFQPLWTDYEKGASIPRDYETGEGYYISYPATDGVIEFDDYYEERSSCACKPSIHMPRWASRITLEVINVRVERLQDISEEDAREEGLRIGMGGSPFFSCCDAFRSLWDSLNAKRGLDWEANPWVWVIEFRPVQK